MRGVLLAIGLAILPVSAMAAEAGAVPLSAGDLAAYRAAFKAADAGRWPDAKARAAEARDPLLAKVLLWLRLVRPGADASFDEIARFLDKNPDWPKTDALRERAEDTMPDDLPPAQACAWFERHPPVSATGKIRFAEALLASGQAQPGLERLLRAWITGNFGERQELIFLFKHHEQLRPADHVARLDRLLWDGQARAARDMLKRVDQGHATLGMARLELQDMAAGVEWALRRVPTELRNDPGLQFDRLRWRRRKNLDDQAREILLHPPAGLVRPELWWAERSIETHRALNQGYISEALRLAEHHGQAPGTASYAEAEWLSGWIALRLLQEPARALKHFEAMAEAVRYPLSRSRALYWTGRAYEAMGARAQATEAYSAAAPFAMTYYGQLAAIRLDPAARPSLPPPPQPAVFQREAFDGRELVRAVRQLGQIGDEVLAEVFIKQLATLANEPLEAELVADLAIEQTRPDLAVRFVRHTWHGEIPLTMHSYPLRPLPGSISAEGALVLAVIRQESAFDVKAVSRAGALGLMQLMPATARKTASGLGLGFGASRLTEDPDFNVRLGGAYLGALLDDFGGNYVLALAAYNAGPGRVREWMRLNGDPRAPDVDVVDWIETIPFDETRNYVQRVLEALHIYRERLTGTKVELDLGKDLRGARRVSSAP